MPAIEPRKIDLLIDGELDSDDQARLMLQCEEHPQNWREVALAYIEAQALSQGLKDLVAVPTASLSQRVLVKNKAHRSTGRTRRGPHEWRQPSPRPLRLVAAVLVSLGMGYGLGLMWQRVRPDKQIATAVTEPRSATESIPNAVESTDDPTPQMIQVTVADPITRELRQVDVPILDVTGHGRDWRERVPGGVPTDLVQAMRALGHDVRQNRSYQFLRLRDGRRVLLPVDDIEVSFSGYQ